MKVDGTLLYLGHESEDDLVADLGVHLKWFERQASVLANSDVVGHCRSGGSQKGGSEEVLGEMHVCKI